MFRRAPAPYTLFLMVLPTVLAFVGLPACRRTPPAPATITVFAAASTADVLTAIAAAFEQRFSTKLHFSFDSTSNLARQIKAGAPADLFLSADAKWMDDVEAAGALRPQSRQNLLANQLVLIAPAASSLALEARRDFDFTSAAEPIKRLAMADPAHVPAGRYGRQSLEWLGWWALLEPRLIAAQDVRAALRLVEIGEADAGIVYATDARRSNNVKLIATFPPESHQPIVYPIALTSTSSPAAADFLTFLRSPEAREVFERAGFVLVPPQEGPR